MKIKVKLFEGGKMPQVNEKGDLFDVFAREEVSLIAPQAGVQHQVNNIKVNRLSLCRGKQGFVEVPELDFKAEINNSLSGILSLST